MKLPRIVMLMLIVALAEGVWAQPAPVSEPGPALKAANAKVSGRGDVRVISLEWPDRADEALWTELAALKPTGLVIRGRAFTNAHAARLAPLADRLESLAIDGSSLTDAGLEHLAALKNLRELKLWHHRAILGPGAAHLVHLDKLQLLVFAGTQFGDEGLKHVAKLRRLRQLDLHHSAVTDAGLAHLNRLTELEVLKLAPGLKTPRITDAGLKHIARLTALKELTLNETVLSFGEGLKHLACLEHLRKVEMRSVGVSASDLASFKKACPDCQVDWTEAPAEAVRRWLELYKK